jgi:hypothetical protein
MPYILPIITLILGYIFGRYIKLNISKKEQVNHPAHYQKNGKECIEVMEEQFGPKAVYWFCILNAFKYKWRAGYKAGNDYDQDQAKAKWYANYADKLNSIHNNTLSGVSSD